MILTTKQVNELYLRAKRIAPKLKKDVENTKFVAKILLSNFKTNSYSRLNRYGDRERVFLRLKFKHTTDIVTGRIIENYGRIKFSTLFDCGGYGNKRSGFGPNIAKEKYLSTFITTTQNYALGHY